MQEPDKRATFKVFCKFLSRAWQALTASLGTTTLSIVVFSLSVPIAIFILNLIYYLYHRPPGQPIAHLVLTAVCNWQTGIAAGVVSFAGIILFFVSSVKTIEADEVTHAKQVEILKSELAARDEQACIGLEIRECHLNARLVGGFGKAIKSGQVDDPLLAFDVFVKVWIVSSFLHPRGIYGLFS